MKDPVCVVTGVCSYAPKLLQPEGKSAFYEFRLQLEDKEYGGKSHTGSLVVVRVYGKEASSLQSRIKKGDVVSLSGSAKAEAAQSKITQKWYGNLVLTTFANQISVEWSSAQQMPPNAQPTPRPTNNPGTQTASPPAALVVDAKDDAPF
jgi:hypothetical protein